MRLRPFFFASVLLLSGFFLTACDSPEEKEAKYLQRGNVLFEKEDYDRARVEYKNAARINPTSAEVQYRVALVDEAQGNIRDAFKGFTAAEQQDSRHSSALLKLAQYYLVAEQYEQTINRLNTVLETDPNNSQAHALRAALALRNKNLKEAEREAQTALEKDGANVTAFTVLTGIELERKDSAKAARHVEEGIARNPKDLSLLLLKAMVHETEKNLDKVAEAYQAIFALKPKAVRFRSDLASIYANAGQKDKAEAVLREAVAALPESKEMKNKLFSFIAETQGLDTAEKEIRETMPENEAVFWLADLYIKHKDSARAITLLEEMIAKDSKERGTQGSLTNARASLARLYFSKGNKDLAQKLVAAVLEKEANNADALFIRASLSFEQGRYQDAVSDLRTIVRDNPKASPALLLLSETLLAQGHLDLAIDTLNQLMVVDPSHKNAQVRLAQLFGLRGETNRAKELLGIVTKNNPDLAVGWETTARLAIETKDWKTAETAVEKLQSLEGQKILALLLQGQIDLMNGRQAQASAKFKEVVLNNPRAPLAEYALSGMVRNAKDAEALKSVAAFMAGLKDPTAYVLTLLGEAYAFLDEKAKAEATLDKAIAMNPTFQEPYIARARIFSAERKPDEALAVLKKAAEVAPGDLRATMAAADIQGAKGAYREAIALYETVLSQNPKADVAANNMAQLIADFQSDDSAAMEKARIAAERFISAPNPLFLDTLAWVYFKQGKIDQAQTVMERVMSYGGNLPAQVHYHHGALLAKQGKLAEAKEALGKALKTDTPYSGLEEAKRLYDGL